MENIMARRTKKPGAELAQQIITQYKPQTVEDMENAPKDIFEPMFEAMLQGEMDSHLGYSTNNYGAKTTDNRRNGYIHKNVKTTHGNVEISIPRYRNASLSLS